MTTVSGNSELIGKLSPYLDNDNDKNPTQQQFQEAIPHPHFSTSPTVQEDQALKTLLKRSVSARKASPEFMDKLRSKLDFLPPR